MLKSRPKQKQILLTEVAFPKKLSQYCMDSEACSVTFYHMSAEAETQGCIPTSGSSSVQG